MKVKHLLFFLKMTIGVKYTTRMVYDVKKNRRKNIEIYSENKYSRNGRFLHNILILPYSIAWQFLHKDLSNICITVKIIVENLF